MQGRREEETGAYWVVREDFRRPRTQQMDFFSSLLEQAVEVREIGDHWMAGFAIDLPPARVPCRGETGLGRPHHVQLEVVPHEERLVRSDAETLERGVEQHPVRLSPDALAREYG